MSLRDDIQADLAAAFDADLSDAISSFTASRETVSDVFDPVAGTYPTVTVTYSGRGVFAGYEINEIDGQHIQATDRLLIALQNEITETPAVDDIIDGARVVTVGKDPADATWEVQLRRT